MISSVSQIDCILPKDITWNRSTYGTKAVALSTIEAPPHGVRWTAREISLWTLGKLESKADLNSSTREAKFAISLAFTALQPAPVEVGYSQSTIEKVRCISESR
jgi:hypothetical protein